MATIIPFRGAQYDIAAAGAIGDLVCPPYDIISHEHQQALYRKSPYNVVRLEFGLESPADSASDNRYTRSAAQLEEWFRSGILTQRDRPAFYIYEMDFRSGGRHRKLRGFIGLVKLEDYESGVVKPHETTLSGPKTDRLNLLRACRAHFSQIFSLLPDQEGTIAQVLGSTTGKPELETKSDDGVVHRLWTMSKQEHVDMIVRATAGKNIFIADGHHRYDTALNYRNERRAAAGSASGQEGFDFVPMFLARMEDPALTVLPAHRVLFNLKDFHPRKFENDLQQYFDIERIDFTKRSEAADRSTVLDTMAHRAERSHTFGMRVKGEHCYYLLTLRSESAMDGIVPAKAPAYRRLDVSILHHLIIDRLLGVAVETHKLGLNIEYIKDANEAIGRVESGEAEVLFLMNPTKVREVREVAAAGERMPQKATYFYPKLLTGLVMYKIE